MSGLFKEMKMTAGHLERVNGSDAYAVVIRVFDDGSGGVYRHADEGDRLVEEGSFENKRGLKRILREMRNE